MVVASFEDDLIEAITLSNFKGVRNSVLEYCTINARVIGKIPIGHSITLTFNEKTMTKHYLYPIGDVPMSFVQMSPLYEEGYNIVTWPLSQELHNEPWFDECKLINHPSAPPCTYNVPLDKYGTFMAKMGMSLKYQMTYMGEGEFE